MWWATIPESLPVGIFPVVSSSGDPCINIILPLYIAVFFVSFIYVSIASLAVLIWFFKDSFDSGMYLVPEVVPEVLQKYFGSPGHNTFSFPSLIKSI